jgi:hypothetical protein
VHGQLSGLMSGAARPFLAMTATVVVAMVAIVIFSRQEVSMFVDRVSATLDWMGTHGGIKLWAAGIIILILAILLARSAR